MFRETVVHQGGTSEGTASERHALMLAARALRRGYALDVTRDGGLTITWTERTLNAPAGTPRSITLAPHLPVGRALTEVTRHDLALIEGTPDAAYDPDRRVITGGWWRIPQGATARLRARSLIATDGPRVRLTLPTRLGLFARLHITRTTEPGGWQRPADTGALTAGLNKPGRRAGMTYSAASVALCSCGYAHHCDDRPEARRRTTAHRQEEAARFLRALTAPTGGQSADAAPA